MQIKNRIVSLIASATEIVCALGLRESMVGRSHECDFPANIYDLPICTGPKFEPDGTSYEIDQKVKAVLQESLSVYRVDAELLDSLRPTHIITQSQCEVCAVSLRDVEEAACKLIASQPQIISLEPNELEDVWRDIEKVSNALGVPEHGLKLIDELKARMESIREQSRSIEPRVRITFVEWIEPLMMGGNWMPALIEMAGAVSVRLDANPDVVLVAPCGFDIKRTLTDMTSLPKVHDKARIYVADGNQYFNRPGPRLVESLEIIAEVCYPKVFHFGHQTTGWIPFAGETIG